MRFRRTAVAAVGAAILVATVASLVDLHPLKRSSGKLRHEAYVWQRRWDVSVTRALGESIFTEGDTLDALHAKVREAVQCHFDEARRPKVGRLQASELRRGPNSWNRTPRQPSNPS